MPNYPKETLQQLDEIVSKLKNDQYIDVEAYDRTLFDILEMNQWVEVMRGEYGSILRVHKSKIFNALVLRGMPSQTPIR